MPCELGGLARAVSLFSFCNGVSGFENKLALDRVVILEIDTLA
jgi:hypothetical protein